MFRIVAVALYLFVANVSWAGDIVLPIAFVDSTMVFGGKKVKCDLYYILLGDKGALDKGDLIQITQLHNDREHYGKERARFSASPKLDRLTIHWRAGEGQKFGMIEKGRLAMTDGKKLRIEYTIDEHDDESQVGQKLRARIVSFERLPNWVRAAVVPNIVAKLPLEQQREYHRIETMKLQMTKEIVEGYLSTVGK